MIRARLGTVGSWNAAGLRCCNGFILSRLAAGSVARPAAYCLFLIARKSLFLFC